MSLQPRLIEINGDSFGSTNLLGDLACRLQVPTSDKYWNVGIPIAEPPDGSTPDPTTPAKVSVLSS